MDHLKTFESFSNFNDRLINPSDSISEIESDIKNILLDLSDEGMETILKISTTNKIEIRIDRCVDKKSTWSDIKDVVLRIGNYMNEIRSSPDWPLRIRYYMDDYIVVFNASSQEFTQTTYPGAKNYSTVAPTQSFRKFEIYID